MKKEGDDADGVGYKEEEKGGEKVEEKNERCK